MAVTINNTPQAFTPSDNPVWFTFSSDQTAETNFSFLVEVYINDTLVANELIFPDSGINARFNAQSYASNACNSPQVVDQIFTDALNYAQVKIKVIERYGDPIADSLIICTQIMHFQAQVLIIFQTFQAIKRDW